MKKITLKVDGKEIEVSKEELLSMLKEDKSKQPVVDKPLRSLGKRKLKYINHYGLEVWLDEETAFQFHSQMKEFLGDQDGNMTPPRDMRRTFHKANGEIIGTTLPNSL